MPAVVVVDDDAEVRDMIREYLSDEGFAVSEAEDGEAMWSQIARCSPQLVLLDLKLSGTDGLTLARDLRIRHPAIAIVIISGKEDVVDRVAGLEVGADDYLVKPFHLRELLARVRSVLRRGAAAAPASDAGRAGSDSAPAGAVYRFAGWTLDTRRRTVTGEGDRAANLTGGEFDLLHAFVSHPNRALTRDQLLDYARSRENENFGRSIDVQVGRLRRKIEANPKRPTLLRTVRNVGYMLRAEVTKS